MKTLLRASLFFAALMGMVAVLAQPYPNRPIKFVVPFPPGGNLDFIARAIQPRFSEHLGATLIIDNKSGAAGIVGAEFAVRQPADG